MVFLIKIFQEDDPNKTSIGNKVLIGSVTSLFILFAIFIVCLWFCKNYKVFCWADRFANSSSVTPPQQEVIAFYN